MTELPYADSSPGSPDGPGEIIVNLTHALNRWRQGQAGEEELNRLLVQISPELKSMASRILRRSGRDLRLVQTSDVFSEFYFRVSDRRTDWANRRQFYGVATQLMRWIVVDLARRELGTKKKGAGNRPSRQHVPFEENDQVIQSIAQAAGLPSAGLRAISEQIMSVHEGLEALEHFNPRAARIVEQYYFGGLTEEEITQTLQLGLTTVRKQFKLGKLFLRRFFEGRQRVQPLRRKGAR